MASYVKSMLIKLKVEKDDRDFHVLGPEEATSILQMLLNERTNAASASPIFLGLSS